MNGKCLVVLYKVNEILSIHTRWISFTHFGMSQWTNIHAKKHSPYVNIRHMIFFHVEVSKKDEEKKLIIELKVLAYIISIFRFPQSCIFETTFTIER